MQYFFDIHYGDKVFPDDVAKSFALPMRPNSSSSIPATEFLAAGRKPNAKVFAQAIIEITDRDGYSDIIVVADLFDGRIVPRDKHSPGQDPHASSGP